MRIGRDVRLRACAVAGALSVAACAAFAFIACSTAPTTDSGGTPDAGAPGADGARDGRAEDAANDGGSRSDAATGDASDAAVVLDSGGGADAGTDGDASGSDAAPGGPCTFNRDCPSVDRCECDAGDCTCQPGARGTGTNGVTACTDGNDCASSLCVEGTGGTYYCSDECVDASTCGPQLPICEDVALLGRICVRNPDAG